jgi:hypothetical protein
MVLTFNFDNTFISIRDTGHFHWRHDTLFLDHTERSKSDHFLRGRVLLTLMVKCVNRFLFSFRPTKLQGHNPEEHNPDFHPHENLNSLLAFGSLLRFLCTIFELSLSCNIFPSVLKLLNYVFYPSSPLN